MSEEVQNDESEQVNDPIIEVINRGLFEFKNELTDFFQSVSADVEPSSQTSDLVYLLFH